MLYRSSPCTGTLHQLYRALHTTGIMPFALATSLICHQHPSRRLQMSELQLLRAAQLMHKNYDHAGVDRELRSPEYSND